MKEPAPKYAVGTLVFVKNPAEFVHAKKQKFTSRVGRVEKNIYDYGIGSKPGFPDFRGRVLVRFMKRNGRGKEFIDVLHERHLAEWPTP